VVGYEVGSLLSVFIYYLIVIHFADLLCFSWDFRSLEGTQKVQAYLSEQIDGQTRFSRGAIDDVRLDTATSLGPPSEFPIPNSPAGAKGVQAPFRFTLKNPGRTGRGHVRLIQDEDRQWKASILFLNTDDIIGHEETIERPLGLYGGHTKTWAEVRADHIRSVEEDPTVLVGLLFHLCILDFLNSPQYLSWRRTKRAYVCGSL
jgi:hypothetical protein